MRECWGILATKENPPLPIPNSPQQSEINAIRHPVCSTFLLPCKSKVSTKGPQPPRIYEVVASALTVEGVNRLNRICVGLFYVCSRSRSGFERMSALPTGLPWRGKKEKTSVVINIRSHPALNHQRPSGSPINPLSVNSQIGLQRVR